MKKLLPITAMVIGALLLTEVTLRLFVPINYMKPPASLPENAWRNLIHQPSAVPGLSFEVAPNQEKMYRGVTVRTNSYGMRDDEPLIADDGSICNVVVIGDSATFGFRVPGDTTYPSVLETLLAANPTDETVQVLNMGVGGYSIRDEVLLFQDRGLTWNPDLLIIGYALNDPETEPVQPLQMYYQDVRWWQYSSLLRAAASMKQGYELRNYGNGNYFRYLHAPELEKWQSVLDSFAMIRNVTVDNDVAVLVIVFPMLRGVTPLLWGDSWDQYPYRDIHAQVIETAQDYGFHTLDLYDSYSKFPAKDIMVAPRDTHPSVLAHKLAAEEIAATIQRDGLLRCN